jgi:hypothetical protein
MGTLLSQRTVIPIGFLGKILLGRERKTGKLPKYSASNVTNN